MMEISGQAAEATEAVELEEQEDQAQESSLELEIIDDTPEEDRVPPRKEGTEPDIPQEDEISNYSKNAQTRIKQLKYEYHEERRRKEEASRMREEAVSYAQKLHEENEKLKKALEDGEGVLIDQAKGRVEAQIDKAKIAYKEAYESGDPDALVEAQSKLSELQAEKIKVSSFKPQKRAETPPLVTEPPKVNEPDERTKKWASENEWFGQDNEMTGFAFGVHESLVKSGVNPQTQADEYYSRIDASMRQRFPDKFEGQEVEEAPARQTGPVVAPANRSAKKPRKVQLTSTQVSLAKRLGLSPEQYAAQLLKESSNV